MKGNSARQISSSHRPTFLEILPRFVRKHYAKWSPARQARIDDLMERVHAGSDWTAPE